MEAAVHPPLQVVPSFSADQLSPTSKKRNYNGDIVNHTSTEVTATKEQRSSPSPGHSRSGSPACSRASTPLTEIGSTPAHSPSAAIDMTSESKKRKLTFAEREAAKRVKQQEKEDKERQKAEKEKLKAEARAKKDEEKKRKDEEKEAARKAREEKQKQKDALKQEKEAEKERKMKEAQKKEKAQLRIGAFFGRPAAASTPPASSDDVSVTSRRSSVASIDMGPSLVEVKSAKPTNPDFSNWILPFFVNEHMQLAPFNRFRSHTTPFSEDQLQLNQRIIPEKISSRFRRRRRARRVKPVKQILEELNSAEDSVIDLTRRIDALASVPYKYFFFQEDVRPPYQGTYTRVVSPRSARKIAVNPSYRGLPNTDYDYDSEAEWQEPEEGDDDLMDEDEKSEDEEGEEEMDDFLDDEGEVVKRQVIVGDMEPKSSGLCWEGEDHQPENGFDLTLYRMDVLHDSTTFPIDPYSTTHWSDIGKTSPKKREDKSHSSNLKSVMQPPRSPLVAVDGNNGGSTTLLGYVSVQGQTEPKSSTSKVCASNTAGSGKPLRMIAEDLLPAFKDAVSGSTLTKTGLIEVLKKQFPKCSKDAIKNTLETIAERQGLKEVDKKWVLTQ
ncbi:chromatin assembly factor-I (CAF-I) p90 subunit [Exophiala dermatitidis]|uniref:Chromatin assembly factor 1 subunit A n=2 Tax=Exophiala dermatitidis TaxID=5970 RepID=H6BVX3_EXODN|nr:uncharacterized protein HMPREF1120_03279 [Exophiala dermatitidis NIH/UT8656]KAJ4508110.1 chromatin assembly factor-I (CAF-I) p90 subunit [Exophiala dermatitidis]EHY55127.1 hypothetical protein HMPREF1120_03279 [Exophiala dermatitidis NIH/UT8656]KAJ4510790.1 chromatin assembly factor-I (CAF-I) p90 subunit [Exophiala dermatitidis]KAJ4513176.1 chromatin assembly factor-I (CAF-I) p90 subunit [Exophiala dermatitidis]KAJ4531953.1 chromatin assembly factor-I (CAF-I) p90 subunit [Exophiala dermatit